jgi:hypothetical protein
MQLKCASLLVTGDFSEWLSLKMVNERFSELVSNLKEIKQKLKI